VPVSSLGCRPGAPDKVAASAERTCSDRDAAQDPVASPQGDDAHHRASWGDADLSGGKGARQLHITVPRIDIEGLQKVRGRGRTRRGRDGAYFLYSREIPNPKPEPKSPDF